MSPTSYIGVSDDRRVESKVTSLLNLKNGPFFYKWSNLSAVAHPIDFRIGHI